jgi:transposase
MKRYIEGESREQMALLPECLDDYIAEDNPIRAIEVFIDGLDLVSLGFAGAEPAATGRPSYHPAVMLKLYLYGYLNRIQSSRRLERESQRNVELMWLLGRLTPDFKTIADFRRDNGSPIRGVCREFVVMCRKLNLFAQTTIAIDGSKFKAVNSSDNNFSYGKLERRIQLIDQRIDSYLKSLDTADRHPSDLTESKTDGLRQKIALLKSQLAELKAMQTAIEKTAEGQISLVDADSRAMATTPNNGIVGYNVQTAVDTKHHLIVAHEVTNAVGDRSQLACMAKAAKEILDVSELTVIADRGYFKGEEIRACDTAGIKALVPKPLTSTARANGRFGNDDFIYDPVADEYQCPAGKRAIWRYTSVAQGMNINRYWSSDCIRCAIKDQCTPSPYRRISRWEHQNVLDAMQRRLDQTPNAMSIRRRTVEHPFGTIKQWMGATHFLMRGRKNVRTEMSLHVLSYNLRRVMNILGIPGLNKAMRQMGA